MIGKTISHYRILEKLGEGGMGVVYKAHDTRLKRTVALKFLPPELTRDTTAKERFIQEAQAASALQHQNICTIHDIDETDDGQMFLCMDYYEGQTLREKTGHGMLKIEDAVDITAQVARGLTRAHTHGIVHRDIKPENIIVTGDNLVKIMDFGLAKLKGASRLTRSHSTVGTLSYMSPEQAGGQEVDQRSDLFSLGIVFYEMITGRRPFKGEHEAAIIYSVLNETPEPLSRYASGVSAELQHIVDKAMTKDPDKRYQHADEMLADLKGVLGETRGPIPQIPRGSMKLGLRRLPLLWTSAGLVAALAVVAGWYFLKGPQPSSKPAPPPTVAEIEWKNSLAVLPFRDFSSKKDQEYFCNGMTDAIIGRLAKIPELKVMATTSVMRYKDTDKDIKEIGRELNVANVLEGTLQREKNKIRLSAQLISAENGFHLWSDTYDRDAAKVFEIQDNISQAIAEALKVQLTAGARATSKAGQPQSLETYEYHLKGMNLVSRYLLNPKEEDFDAALSMFRKAIEIEPDYAASYTGLAWVYQHHMEVTGKENEAAQVVKYSELAYQKNPNSPEANTAMGWVCHLRGDDDQAYKYFRRGLELNPNSMAINYVTGIFFSNLGLCYQAIKFLERAVDLDPFYLYALSSQAGRWRDIGEFGKAEAIYKKAMVLAPYEVTYPASYAYLLVMLHHYDRADELWKQAEKLKPGDPLMIRTRALLCAVTGDKEQALAVMQPSDEMVYALLTMKEEAIAALSKKTVEGRENMYLQLTHNPFYNTLRSDPRFQEIVNRERKIYDDLVKRFGDL